MTKKINLSLLLAVFLCLSASTVAKASDATAYKLEKALSKYILCYEAYVSAKQSGDPAVRAQLPQYIKNYRESYAQYLELLNKEGLYKPTSKQNNPAGAYNKKQKKKGKPQRKWKIAANKQERESVKQMVREGRNVEEVMLAVQQNLPSTPNSETDYVTCPPTTAATSNSTLTNYDDDDDDDDDAYEDWLKEDLETQTMLGGNTVIFQPGKQWCKKCNDYRNLNHGHFKEQSNNDGNNNCPGD